MRNYNAWFERETGIRASISAWPVEVVTKHNESRARKEIHSGGKAYAKGIPRSWSPCRPRRSQTPNRRGQKVNVSEGALASGWENRVAPG